MKGLAALVALVVLLTGHQFAITADHETSPTVLVELFTSQGCSSCPPADRLLARLAREGQVDGIEVIPLAFHVDYWNYIGWQDPFSSEAWSDRQRAYATAMGLDTIYTPQIVLNGSRQIVGAREAEIRQAIRHAVAASPAAVDLRVRELTSGKSLRLEVRGSIPDGASHQKVLGMLALFQDGLVTPVSRGENAERTLENERVIRELQAVFELTPNEKPATTRTVELPLNSQWPVRDLGVALFLQDPETMEILAAASHRLQP